MRSRVACLVVGAVALTAGVATGCGGDDGDSEDSTPEGAVQQFFDASSDGDGAAACEVLSTASQEQAVEEAQDAEDCAAAFQEDADAGNINVPEDLEVGEFNEEDSTVEITSGGQSSPINVIEEDGEWKIDLVGEGAG